MEKLNPGQLRFRVHGPNPKSEEMSAAVFADKLMTLVRAVRAADRAANGRQIHDYMIAKLQSSAPTALLAERPIPRYKDRFFSGHSGIKAFERCVNAIESGQREHALS